MIIIVELNYFYIFETFILKNVSVTYYNIILISKRLIILFEKYEYSLTLYNNIMWHIITFKFIYYVNKYVMKINYCINLKGNYHIVTDLQLIFIINY